MNWWCKHITRRAFSVLLIIALVLPCMGTVKVMATGGRISFVEMYTDKAMYAPGDVAKIYLYVKNDTTQNYADTIYLDVYHLDIHVGTNSVAVELLPEEKKVVEIPWVCPANDFTGYVVKASTSEGTMIDTAIDVSSDFSHFPRYGYTVDFDVNETQEESDTLVKTLAQKYHINVVQYYDWMWRHEQVLPDQNADRWLDMFGNEISKDSILQRISAGHEYNQNAMAYQMAYMAREDYESYGVKKEWGLYSDKDYDTYYDKNNTQTINEIDQLNFPLEGNPPVILYTFNPENDEWQQYMINQYKTAIDALGFDGIHIDQMGSFWGDINYYDYYGNYVDLGKTFSGYVDAVKSELNSSYTDEKYVTMNMVNGGVPSKDKFSSETITKYADTDFSFSELWENSQNYNDVKNFVEWNRKTTNKPVVLAAYMNQYNNIGYNYEAENAQNIGLYTRTNNENITYVSGFDEIGDELIFNVNVPEDNYYDLVFTYSNGTSARSTKTVCVDSNEVATISFDPTREGMIPTAPSWGSFSSENAFLSPKTLFLSAGNHSISVRQSDNESCDVQIDKLTLGMFNSESVKLTDAVFAACGAYHIEMGTGLSTANSTDGYSDIAMLGHPYYPKAYKTMTNELKDSMKTYYDFITGYENLLYDSDVLASDGGLQNVSVEGFNISGSGENGKIWIIPKSKGSEYSILHMINLTSEEDTIWRNSTSAPNQLNNINVKYYFTNNTTIDGVFIASPDNGNCLSNSLEYSIGRDGKGKYVSFSVPSLEYWDMIYIKWSNQSFDSFIEAEDMILANVNFNNNHAGYSGNGFVDGFGDLFDSVTFDVSIENEDDYSIKFQYSNATGNECSRELIVDNESYGKVTFLPNASWDEWVITEKGLHLTKGSHRLVLLTTSEYGGFINLDYAKIESRESSGRAFYMNNWDNMCFIWKASEVNPAQDRLSDGPSIYEMRYYDGTENGNYNINNIKNYSMFLRDANSGSVYTNGSQFDSVGYFDNNGILNTKYESYGDAALPVTISRNYNVVPNEKFMVVQYVVTNDSNEAKSIKILDMLHLNNTGDGNVSSNYDSTKNAIINDMTSAGQNYVVYGSLDSIDGYQIADDTVSAISNNACSPWVTFNANGSVLNNSSVNAKDVSNAFVKNVSLSANETKKFYFYIGIGDTSTSAESLINNVRTKSGEEWFAETSAAYSEWLNSGKRTTLPDSKLNDAYDSILVFLKQSIVPGEYTDLNGASVVKYAAMPATTNSSAYSYKVWARDSAVSAMSLDASGHTDEAGKYWLWLADRQISSSEGDWRQPGAFWTCYWIWDNSSVSFVEPEYDSIGMFLIGAYRHYQALSADEKEEFLQKIWPAYERSANLVCNGMAWNGFGAADCSIWEEQGEYNAFTEALYVAGLNAAQYMAEAKGELAKADIYNGAASTIRSAIQRSCTDSPAGLFNSTDYYSDWWYYNRAVNTDGTYRATVDSSSDVLFTYGVFDMLSKRSYSHYNKITATISGDRLGIARYQGDTFYTGKNSWDPGGAEALEDQPSWPQMTMWVAMMELFSGYSSLKEKGYERLLWYVDRTNEGYMPAGECISNITLKPLMSTAAEPITGAAYIMTALAYDEKFDMRITPNQYNAGAYSNVTVSDGTRRDWKQWRYVPYYLDKTKDAIDESKDISKVYICNDTNNLYIRIDTLEKVLPEYNASDAFEIAVYCEDAKTENGHGVSQTLHQTNVSRDLKFAFVRNSRTSGYTKYTNNNSIWQFEKNIDYVIAPQWEPSSGRIEMVIPLSELSRHGNVTYDDWTNLLISIGVERDGVYSDSDTMAIHYRITSPNQSWLFGSTEE